MKEIGKAGSTIADRLAAYFAAQGSAGIVAVYLFGSEAAGRAHRESDVDVGVLVDYHAYPARERRADLAVTLGSALIHALRRNDVDVVILNDAPPELGRAIVTRG